MLASEVIQAYEAFCPQEFSMEGDSRGLQIGTLDKEIQRVMVALDIREETVAEAIEKGVDLIIVKHAPIFRSIKDLVASRPQIRFTSTLSSMTSPFMSVTPILTSLRMVSMIGSARC